MQHSPWDPEGVETALDHQGLLADPARAEGVDLRLLYKRLVGARCLDLKLSRLALPIFASAAGEEAPLVALGMLARSEERVYVGARDVALALTRGVEVEEILRQAIGHPSSETAGRLAAGLVAAPAHGIAPLTESLGVGVGLACGEAHAQRIAASHRATAVVFGEGLTTTGPLQESVAIAVQRDLPLVLVCKSRLWPAGAPAEAGQLGDSVAERFAGWGLRVRRCDGADPVGTFVAIRAALERARNDEGPTFVEVVVTPQAAGGASHETAEAPPPPPERDPVERLRRFLDRAGQWSQTFQDVIEAEIHGRFDRARESLDPEAFRPTARGGRSRR